MVHKITKTNKETEETDAETFESIYEGLIYFLTEEEKERAICYLIDNIPKNAFMEVWNEMQKRGTIWWLPYQWGFGGRVRTILRQGGFEWGSITLEDRWAEMVEEAAKRVMTFSKDDKHE